MNRNYIFYKRIVFYVLIYAGICSLISSFVLIDGRFRVASFLTSIKFCDDGCKIIFDDYANRTHYHVVEEIIKPIKIFGNQALFEVKDRNSLQENEIDQLLRSFEHVRD